MKTEEEIKEILRKKIKKLSKLKNLKGKDFLRGIDEIDFSGKRISVTRRNIIRFFRRTY